MKRKVKNELRKIKTREAMAKRQAKKTGQDCLSLVLDDDYYSTAKYDYPEYSDNVFNYYN